MKHGFRLLSVSGSLVRHSRLAGRYQAEESIDVELAPPDESVASSWVSVMIGKNGVGKSRLLAAIADIFDRISRNNLTLQTDNFVLSRVDYLVGENRCVIAAQGGRRYELLVNGSPCEPSRMPLPGRIIAVTTSPFDKFRLSQPVRYDAGIPQLEEDHYAYFGLRDRSGRASANASVFRALEGLFDAARGPEERRTRIAEVFDFLGFAPVIEVRYATTSSEHRRLQAFAEGVPLAEIVGDARTDRIRLLDRLDDDSDDMTSIRRYAAEALELIGKRGELHLQADFRNYMEDDDLFWRMQRLKNLRLIFLRSIEVQRTADGQFIDLRLASSGELSIVTSFLGLASAICDSSLVLIDEPEISLHPEWQTRFVDLLTRTFAAYSGSHFMLATHSPLILADIDPGASNVVSLDPDRRRSEDGRQVAGKSIDFLLATHFDEPGRNNLYLKEEIIKALRLAADGKSDTPAFMETLNVLSESLPRLDQDSPVARLIGELQEVAERSGRR